MDPAVPADIPLPSIPLINVGRGGAPALLAAAQSRAHELIGIARRRYSPLALHCGDAVSRAWLKRNATPYCGEIEAVAARLGVPGAVMLNLSFEWGCTGLVGPDPAAPNPGQTMRMLRVLDWRLPGLGHHVVVARVESGAGPYYDVTWPGAAGVLTAMAPGRFSAAIHQAPMRRHGLTFLGDWAKNRSLVWRRTALPPAHLLRHVFETCATFAEAKQALAETPLALPVLFILAGTGPDEACVIERIEDQAVVHHDGGVAGNGWRGPDAFAGCAWSTRGYESDERVRCLGAVCGQPLDDGFAWLAPPVLNPDTRLAVRANAAAGTLAVLGIEDMRPATSEFSCAHKDLDATQAAD
jgi:hypothetical protein